MALFQSTSNVVESEIRLNGFENLRETPFRPRTDEAATGRHSSVCTQVVWILFWLTILFTIAYPLALLAALIYVIMNPFSLMDCMKPSMEILFKALNFPSICARNMADAKQLIVM